MARILVVDDSEDLQDTYQMLLESEGYSVIKTSDGAAGLRAVAAERPDVVLLDMMMPEVDGLEFLRRLPIECTSPLPAVIAVSGFEPYRDEALRRGATAFLRKPIEIEVLFEAVRLALASAAVPADLLTHNQQNVLAARTRGEQLRGEIVKQLDEAALAAVKARLKALACWLQRYYGFGAALIQLLHGDELRIQVSHGGAPPWVEGFQYPCELAWCSDVIDAGSTVLLCDPMRHPLPYFSKHPEIAAGFRFYAGVPLTTGSGAVIGTLCLCDFEPRELHAEDMRLLEALGLHVARALEKVASGVDPEDLMLDENALFGVEMLSLFAQIAAQRAARVRGTVGVGVVRLVDVGDAAAAAHAAYAGGHGPGLVAARRNDDEVALVVVDHDRDARDNLCAAVAACQRSVTVERAGIAWCAMTADPNEPGSRTASDVGAALIGLAAETLDRSGYDPHHHHAAA
jgi:CheY-like chemotaxis protein